MLDQLNSTAQDDGGVLSADELTLYFSSARPGQGDYDVYVATRASTADSFGAPSLVAGVSTAGKEEQPNITADGLFMYVTSYATGTSYDISVAQRANTALDFGPAVAVPTLNGAGTQADGNTFVLPNHTAIYFTSNRGGNYDLYRAARNAGGTFDTPVPVSGVNSPSYENSPIVTPDELTIYFNSDRPGGPGTRNIWMARRSTVNDGFGQPTLVTEVSAVDGDQWLGSVSADDCVLVFSRVVSGRGLDLFLATREP